MPMPDVIELFAYWREYPPMHWMMRAYIGFKPQSREDETKEAMQLFGRAAGRKKLADAPARVKFMAESLRKAQRG